tara:strand:+ start:20 stop:415 length:396 start_codon:yes stop_codon:yes gene_type:complete
MFVNSLLPRRRAMSHLTARIETSRAEMANGELDLENLPPPSEKQRARGWKRDYSCVWKEHDESLKCLFVEKAKDALERFKVRTEIDSNGNRISQYDFTGGSVVALAKKRAREDEKNHEKEQLMMWRKNHQR